MAEETVDRAIVEYGLESEVKRPCTTTKIQLVGSHGWSKMMFIKLIQQFGVEVSRPSIEFSRSTSFQDDYRLLTKILYVVFSFV